MDNNTNWLTDFLEELKDAVVECEFTRRWSRVEGYHLVGRMILEQKEKLDKYYGQNVVKKVSEYIGKGERTVRYAMSLASKFPDLDMMPEGKNISWNRIIKKYLDESEDKPKKAKIIKCPECGHEWEK